MSSYAFADQGHSVVLPQPDCLNRHSKIPVSRLVSRSLTGNSASEQETPVHQNALMRRAHRQRLKCRMNSSLRKKCHCCSAAKYRNLRRNPNAQKDQNMICINRLVRGGGSGIRTHDTVAPITLSKRAPSATRPSLRGNEQYSDVDRSHNPGGILPMIVAKACNFRG